MSLIGVYKLILSLVCFFCLTVCLDVLFYSASISFSLPFLFFAFTLLLPFEYLMSTLPLVTMHYFSALLRAHWLLSLPLTPPGLRPEADTVSDSTVSHWSSLFYLTSSHYVTNLNSSNEIACFDCQCIGSTQ